MPGGVIDDGASSRTNERPGASSPADDAEFDLARLESVAALDADGALGLIPQLVATFERDAQEKITAFRRLLQAGDAAAIHALTHQLKSSSGTLGLLHVYRLSRHIDDDARNGGLGEAAALVGTLDEALRAGCAWLRDFATRRTAR